MKALRNILILCLSLNLGNQLMAQHSVGNLFTNNEQRGDAMFEDLYYQQAITYYKLALKRNSEDNSLRFKIANSYRLLSDYEASLIWYTQAFGMNPDPADSVHNLYYADALTSAERYDEALDYYRVFWSKAPTDSRATRKMETAGEIDQLGLDSAIVDIELADFNSTYNDLAAIRYSSGFLYLCAMPSGSLSDQDFLREENLFDFFYTDYDSLLGWSNATRLKQGLNSNFFEGPASLFAGENEIIFTRSNIAYGKPLLNSEGRTQLQLFSSTKVGGEWTPAKKLSFCDSEYSYSHPAVNSTGDTIYFSSDMAGGYGGNDIYMSVRQNNEWSEPVNLGYTINSEGNELYPYFIDHRLFFSSNGHGGLGGYDVHKAYFKNGHVHNVVNIGKPINSINDDFAYFIEKESLHGNFTSNRKGGVGGDDIYTFETKARVLAGVVYQEQDGSSIEGARVTLTQYGKGISEVLTDSLGRFRFQLPLGQEFDIDVAKEDHRAIVPIKIPIAAGRIDLDSLMIALHKDDLFAQGRVLDNETQELMDQVRVVLHNATDNDFDTLLTDHNGTYSFVLLPEKTFNIWATKAGYIFGEANINTFEIDSGVIINDIVLELEYEKKSLVYFDFDKYDLTQETRSILSRTAAAMKRTTHQLIISAYADARGTVEYNQKLSDKRANEVLNFFLANGVDRSRIIARGFGEALILNRCVDGVHCEEVEHSKNRRAEIKIEGSNVK